MTTRIRITNLGPSTIRVKDSDGYGRDLAPGESTPSRASDSALYIWPGKEYNVSEKRVGT